MWKTKHRSATTKAQTETRKESTTTLATWKPPHVENTPSILQLHQEDDSRRRCGQCIRLDIRGSMNRLREQQQLHEMMVNVRRRSDMRPFWVLTNLGGKEWHNWNDVPVQIRKDIGRIHRNLGHPSVRQVEKLCRDAKVSTLSDRGPETFLMRCVRLAARRQVAIAHRHVQ